MLDYKDKYFTVWKISIVTDNGNKLDLEKCVRHSLIERFRETYDQLLSFKNSHTLNIPDMPRSITFSPKSWFAEGSNQLFYFNPFDINCFYQTIYSFLYSTSSYSICIKGILSVGSYFLITNHFIPFIHKIFNKFLRIFRLLLVGVIAKLRVYIKSAPSGQKSSSGFFEQNNQISFNDIDYKTQIGFLLNGNQDNGDGDDEEFNKRNPERFNLMPHLLSFLSRAQIERLVVLLRVFLDDIRNNRFRFTTSINNSSVVNQPLIFNHITELSDIFNVLSRAINERNTPNYTRVYRIYYLLNIFLNMLRRVQNLVGSLPLNQISVSRLHYYTLPGHIDPGIVNAFTPWYYMFNIHANEVYSFGIPLNNVNHHLPRGFVLIYSERYWYNALSILLYDLNRYLNFYIQ